ETIPFSTLVAIAKGVPRSFPFHNLAVHFKSPAFGVSFPIAGPLAAMDPGIVVHDSWWVSGRSRSVTAVASVDADPRSTTLPSPRDDVAAVLAACGKVKETTQVLLAASAQGSTIAAAPQDVAQAVAAVL